jgi:uncharacterized membrane protein YgcG
MGASVRKRPQRLLIALAVTAVAVAASLAIIAPLHAQEPTQVGFRFPDGQNAFVTGEEIKQQGTKHSFHIGKDRVIKQGMTLSQVLDVAQQKRGSRISGVGVYALDRAPSQPLYLTENGDRLIFVSELGVIKWFYLDANGDMVLRGSGVSVAMQALEGELLAVKITAPTTIEAGTEVEFKATATGELKDEKLAYRWYVDGGEQIVGRGQSFKHTFKKQSKGHSVYVDVRGDKGSRGSDEVIVDVGKKTPPASSGGSGGTGSGGTGGTGSGGTGSGGTGGSGAGGGTPGYTPPPSPPSSSPLPPPSSSPPPSSPGRGPNLDPSAPSGGTSGQRVEGVLVSVSLPARPSSGRPGQTAQGRQQQAKSKSNGVDWPLVGGISLTALLVILGAVRERRHIRRLLPHPTPQTS